MKSVGGEGGGASGFSPRACSVGIPHGEPSAISRAEKCGKTPSCAPSSVDEPSPSTESGRRTPALPHLSPGDGNPTHHPLSVILPKLLPIVLRQTGIRPIIRRPPHEAQVQHVDVLPIGRPAAVRLELAEIPEGSGGPALLGEGAVEDDGLLLGELGEEGVEGGLEVCGGDVDGCLDAASYVVLWGVLVRWCMCGVGDGNGGTGRVREGGYMWGCVGPSWRCEGGAYRHRARRRWRSSGPGYPPRRGSFPRAPLRSCASDFR